MGVTEIKSKKEFDETVNSNDIVFVDCFATWCGPCKVISPVFEKLSEEFQSATFIKIDVDELPDVAQELGVRAMPTFFAFKNGEQSGDMLGANPPGLRQLVEGVVVA